MHNVSALTDSNTFTIQITFFHSKQYAIGTSTLLVWSIAKYINLAWRTTSYQLSDQLWADLSFLTINFLYHQLFLNHCSYRLSIHTKASMRRRRKQICLRQPVKQGRWDPNCIHHLLCCLFVCCLTEASTTQRQKTNNDKHTTLHITVCQRFI